MREIREMRESKFNKIQKKINSELDLSIHYLRRDITQENEFIYRTNIFNELKDKIKNSADLDDRIIDTLEGFLSKNAITVRSSSLCYTSTPDMDVTLLLCDIAELIADYKGDKGIQQSKLQILMPHLSQIDPMHCPYPNPHKIDLKTVLQTHVLINEGRYLLPVSYFINNPYGINSYPSLRDDNTAYKNPYFNEYTADKNNDRYLDRCDIERLKRHSDITYFLAEISQDNYLNSNKKLNLLSKINTLINALNHMGTSLKRKEPQVVNIISCAAFSFSRYYDMLSDEKKNEIDIDFREHLNKLSGIIDSLRRYINERESIDTIFSNFDTLCTIVRPLIRKEIYDSIVLIQQSFTVLSREMRSNLECISIMKDDDLQAYGTFLADHKQKLTEELKTEIEEGTYIGSDKHFLTMDILSAFQLTIPMEEEYDIETLLIIDTKTLEFFFEYDNELTDRIGRIIVLPYDLFKNSSNGKIENWEIILKNMKSKIVSLFNTGTLLSGFENSDDTVHDRAKLFTDWLDIVGDERAKMICSTLKPVLNNIICTSEHFNLVLKALDQNKRDILYDQMNDDLEIFIKSGEDLGILFEHLTNTQKIELYNQHRTNQNLIQNIKSFRDTLMVLPGDQKQNFFDYAKENISNQILTDTSTYYPEHKISIAMEQLSISQQKELLSEVGNRIESSTNTDPQYTEKEENRLFLDIDDLDKIVKSIDASNQKLFRDVFRPYILNIANKLNKYGQIRKISKHLEKDDKKSLHTKYINTKWKTISYLELKTEEKELDTTDKKILYNSLLSKLASDEFTIIFETIKKSNRLSKNSLRTIKPEMKDYSASNAIEIINEFFCKISANPNSVEAHAWEIYKNHHENIHTNNQTLMEDIYKSGLKVSFMGISHASSNNLFFSKAPTNTRREKIFKSIKKWGDFNKNQSQLIKHYIDNSLKHNASGPTKLNSTSNTSLNTRKNKTIDSHIAIEETCSRCVY